MKKGEGAGDRERESKRKRESVCLREVRGEDLEVDPADSPT